MANDKLTIGPEAMESAKNEYDNYSQQMSALKTKLTNSVNALRTDWNSEGGEAFFDKFDNTWQTSFTQYIDVINHMSAQLESAKTQYQTVIDEVNKLNT